MYVTRKLVLIALSASLLAGCTDDARAPSKVGELSTSPQAMSFHIVVSNQSFDDDPVDIDVYIDGIHAVTGDFFVEGQHSWHTFDFRLDSGMHTVRAVGHGGDAVLEEIFATTKETWIVLNYWYYPPDGSSDEGIERSFSFSEHEMAPAFD